MIKKFASYYKPYLGLFFFDLFCAVLVAACNLGYPYLAQDILKKYVPENNFRMVIIISFALLLIYILKAILTFIIQYWGHILGVKIQGDMRKELFAHLEDLPFSYFDENKTGNIMSRIINDLMDISELAHHGPEDIILSTITLIGACVLMALKVDWRLSLIVFGVVPFITGYAVITRKGMRKAFKKMREETGRINAQVESSISGIRVAKAYTARNHEIAEFEKSNKEFQKARSEAYKQMGIFGSGMQFFTDFLYLVALFVGGLFCTKGMILIDQYVAYILYVTIIISPIRTIVAIYESIQAGFTGFARFTEIINTKKEEDDGKIELKEIKSSITFDHVNFSYKENSLEDEVTEVLHDFSLELPVGSSIALVGPSGGGKTTICHLLPRFYKINSGKIAIDGVDICDYTLNSLRRQIGIVSQEVFLFGGTIRDNVRYGDFDATDEQIIEACKMANIHEFIETLEDGYDTYVGERGVKLSGGQKQRISIARAFLKNPPILILDEATSALDNITEIQIQNALETLSKGRTTIVVAHRLSTVKNADEIVVLTDEGVVEKGKHQELLDKNGIYADLYKHQFR